VRIDTNLGSSRHGTIGEAHWHAPEGDFAYLKFNLDDITSNATDVAQPKRTRNP
jgi:hypothetical protein